MTGDAYPVPLGNSQTSGGGSDRLSFVSVETLLCEGPRNASQLWVAAPGGNCFGLRCTRACADTPFTVTSCTARAWSNERRDIRSIASGSYQRPMPQARESAAAGPEW